MVLLRTEDTDEVAVVELIVRRVEAVRILESAHKTHAAVGLLAVNFVGAGHRAKKKVKK
jgi:hypothetical protein